MSGTQNAPFRDQTANFFQTRALVYEKNRFRAAQHALGSAVIPSLRVDFVSIGTVHNREVVALRVWSANQPHGCFSTSLMAMWVPYTLGQVKEGLVGDVSFIFTAELSGCTVTATRTAAGLSFAHIAHDYVGGDLAARLQAATFTWGPAQYDPRVAGRMGMISHFVCGVKRAGLWDFYAQGKVSGADTYQPTVIYSERVAVGV
jgi:hypothetical protein